MARTLFAIPAVTLALGTVFGGCLSDTSLSGVWTNPDYRKNSLDSVLVVAIAERETERQVFETELVTRLEASGVTAVASTRVLPPDQKLDRETVEAYLAQNSVDAVIVTQLVGVRKEKQHVSGRTYTTASRAGWYGPYSAGWDTTHESGYTYEDTIVTLETSVYDARSHDLIWTGQSESFNPGGIQQIVAPLSRLIVKSLMKEGLIAK